MKTMSAIGLAIPLSGLLASGGLAIGGLGSTASGALAGTLLASASWWVLQLLGRRLVKARSRVRPVAAALIGAKLAVMAGLTWVVIGPLGFDGIGVAVGIGSLPLGIIAAACLLGPDAWGAGLDLAEGAGKDA